MIDAAVWAQVAAILRDPSVIAREVSRHRDDGGWRATSPSWRNGWLGS
jgi:hypothetical protein